MKSTQLQPQDHETRLSDMPPLFQLVFAVEIDTNTLDETQPTLPLPNYG